MRKDWFVLRPLRALRLDDGRIHSAIAVLGELTEGINPAGPAPSADRVAALRKQLRAGFKAGRSFDSSTDVPRRSNLLLWVYLEDLASDETKRRIYPFTEEVAISILGSSSGHLRPDLRRLATLLYFSHFGEDRIPGLNWLANRLRDAWQHADPQKLDDAGLTWHSRASLLFYEDAPRKVARRWQNNVTVSQLAQHFSIPEASLFHRQLYEEVILKRVEDLPASATDTDLNQLVVAEKERIVRGGRTLGSLAVEILINRSINEFRSVVPKNWARILVHYACDPRTPSKEARHRWWGWAITYKRDMAIRALSWMSLEEFIKLLEDSLTKESERRQFPKRRDLLIKLFDKGLVIEARLVLPSRMRTQLHRNTIEAIQPSWHSGDENTSIVCLRCTDDVFLIEGTHSFSLRGFIGPDSFPVRRYWDTEPRFYHHTDFRVQESRCTVYQRHQGDYWVENFLNQLRRRHVEWNTGA
jgi:hypothetical protein